MEGALIWLHRGIRAWNDQSRRLWQDVVSEIQCRRLDYIELDDLTIVNEDLERFS